MFAADTNVLIYAVDIEAGRKHDDARAFLALAGRSPAAVLTEQCLIEFLNAAVRKRMRPMSEAAESVRKWMAVFRVIVPDKAVVARTLALLESYNLSVWDARLLATCEANECSLLWSEDLQDRAVYGTVRVLNPFNSANAEFLREAMA